MNFPKTRAAIAAYRSKGPRDLNISGALGKGVRDAFREECSPLPPDFDETVSPSWVEWYIRDLCQHSWPQPILEIVGTECHIRSPVCDHCGASRPLQISEIADELTA